MEEEHHLIDLKNAYYLGNFQLALNEAQKIQKLSVEASVVRDIFVYRAYIAQKKFTLVLDEINLSSPEQLVPLRTFAEFLSAPSTEAKNNIVETLKRQLADGFLPSDATALVVVAATLFLNVDNYESALRVLHQADNLECSALSIVCHLKMDRVDLARKELKNMQDKDEDAILTQLATIWVNIYTGGEKYQEAYYIVQEMIDKYGSTPLMLNLLASIYTAQGKFVEAEGSLREALEKDPNNADTLINLLINSHFIGKSQEASNRFLLQLKDAHPGHGFAEDYYKKENEFDKIARKFSQH